MLACMHAHAYSHSQSTNTDATPNRHTKQAAPQRIRTGMADKLPHIIIRPHGPQEIRKRFGVEYTKDLDQHLDLHRAQIGRVLSGKHAPGNKFIAGVIDQCGLKWAFDHVFEIVSDGGA
jgi:hypothetical protein